MDWLDEVMNLVLCCCATHIPGYVPRGRGNYLITFSILSRPRNFGCYTNNGIPFVIDLTWNLLFVRVAAWGILLGSTPTHHHESMELNSENNIFLERNIRYMYFGFKRHWLFYQPMPMLN